MHLLPLVLLPLTAQAINIVSSNDDGWAEINIRQFYKALTAAGHSVVVSAPAENQSGTGSSDKTPTTLTEPCEFNSCPSGSPATGFNASDPRLNYVNSYPVTSMKYGISTAAPPFFNGAPPALAVSGPNVGSNLGLAVYFSGTVGAAHYAAEAGIPAIAFSGSSGSPTAWNAAVPAYSQVYAQLATKITNKIVASGTPYLPDQVWLNVNFPEVSSECAAADDFKFVLSRIFSGIISADDVETCGSSRLPTESTVVGTDGCYVSISVGWSDKTDAAADVQAIVLDKLGDLLGAVGNSIIEWSQNPSVIPALLTPAAPKVGVLGVKATQLPELTLLRPSRSEVANDAANADWFAEYKRIANMSELPTPPPYRLLQPKAFMSLSSRAISRQRDAY
ncbi:hypothetical protein CNMCM8980_008257 [Aspergillus fumigatiaffinis]|uniref:Survival protein SurE-like phosphatase/nucleotidase domain-containing protein n=1 Tax=Aspergillus fumigatiaffinis TaxID=340414 RepID=A0A8H4H4V2_9EURO|nr:hypothetical protein CNMCM5878_004170 [Aspergillus fumigatiaffinis]KAF4235344.1 hypothetical protein CNMCM6457_003145 [Aspergillus fumigatiaffinis]KAF4241145.1 hypothetical protein CNMCM6805_004305 [Aspergillus fumigatiaffinis]KAF4246628.1 hypothetical protein CNMCM8980_008257 [Aspergillus fumigatiaffinis]